MSFKSLTYEPKRVMIVSRDLAEYDLRAHYGRLSELAESHRCDVLLCALWSEHRPTGANWFPPRSHYFGRTHLLPRFLIHETGQLEDAATDEESDLRLEVWERDSDKPIRRLKIEFATSSASDEKKHRFVEQFTRERLISKRFGVVYCGELNVINTIRNSSRIRDDFNFIEKLHGLSLLTLPFHRRPRRPEVKWKMLALSEGRTVVTTWAQWKGHGYAKKPFWAFRDGKEITDEINEISHTIRDDLRIGVLSL